MYRKIIFTVGVLLLTGLQGRAQSSSAILEEYIQKGLQSNLALQQKNLDWQQSLEAVREAQALFYPSLQFNATYTRAIGGRKIDLPIGDLLNPVYSSLNQLTQSNNFPSISNQSIQFLPDDFQETYIKFAYPLFNSSIRYNKEIQEQLTASKAATRAAYESNLKSEITSAYLQYGQTIEAQKIIEASSKVLLELRRFNESLVRNNVATRDLISAADYEISQLDQKAAEIKAANATARAYFNFLLNKNLESEIALDSQLLIRTVPRYSLDSMIMLAKQNRKELDAAHAGLSAAEAAAQLERAKIKYPEAYIGGQFGFQGTGFQYDKDQAYALAQVGLRYDLYTGGQRQSKVQQARIAADKISVQQLELEQQIALQVTQAWQNLEAARAGLDNAEKALEAASERFRIINNKYRAGQALFLEWTDANNKVNVATLQRVMAHTALQLAEAKLMQSVGE
ncbi:MAG: TolC family protein [Lewinellaceae bacterium]|nr:TolC family protein [Lewinellaceae bacterium]